MLASLGGRLRVLQDILETIEAAALVEEPVTKSYY